MDKGWGLQIFGILFIALKLNLFVLQLVWISSICWYYFPFCASRARKICLLTWCSCFVFPTVLVSLIWCTRNGKDNDAYLSYHPLPLVLVMELSSLSKPCPNHLGVSLVIELVFCGNFYLIFFYYCKWHHVIL